MMIFITAAVVHGPQEYGIVTFWIAFGGGLPRHLIAAARAV
jgi:hypothetical protein